MLQFPTPHDASEPPVRSLAPRERTHRFTNSGLLPSAFLKALEVQVKHSFRYRGQAPHSHARSRLAQFWFGSVSSMHYEVWVHERTAQLEIGFHCESTPDYNRLLYSMLDISLLEIQSALGPSFWLEDWDNGWIRLYESQRLWPLDASRTEEVATRVGELILAVQPLYEAYAALNPPPPVPGDRRKRV